MAKVTAVTTLCPHAGPLRFLLSPKTQMMSQNKRCFALQMPDRCLNPLVLPRGRMLPRRLGGVQGGHGNANLLLGAVQRRPHAVPEAALPQRATGGTAGLCGNGAQLSFPLPRGSSPGVGSGAGGPS